MAHALYFIPLTTNPSLPVASSNYSSSAFRSSSSSSSRSGKHGAGTREGGGAGRGGAKGPRAVCQTSVANHFKSQPMLSTFQTHFQAVHSAHPPDVCHLGALYNPQPKSAVIIFPRWHFFNFLRVPSIRETLYLKLHAVFDKVISVQSIVTLFKSCLEQELLKQASCA